MTSYNKEQRPFLLPSMVPSSEDVYFEDTACFTHGNISLPTPVEVRRDTGPKSTLDSPVHVMFPALNLIVEYGPKHNCHRGPVSLGDSTLASQCARSRSIRLVSGQVETFIYMQLVEEITLEQAWPKFDIEDRFEICQQLRRILENSRMFRQDPSCPFIGMFR